jgi:zinc and cadmium transporter
MLPWLANVGLYAAATFLASLVGGGLLLLLRPTHNHLQTALSFVGGLMLGMVLIHLIPHSISCLSSVHAAMGWTLGGFLTLFFLQRVLGHHDHEVAVSGEGVSPPAETANPTPHAPVLSRRVSWIAVALGLSLHSTIDGITLGAAINLHAHTGDSALGLGMALAIILHKPFDAAALLTLVHRAGGTNRLKWSLNLAIASVTPAALLVTFLGLGTPADPHSEVLGCMLAFSAGAFLCIACSDLLPELKFHAHDRLRLSTALVLGLALPLALGELHQHNHTHTHGTVHGCVESHADPRPANHGAALAPSELH